MTKSEKLLLVPVLRVATLFAGAFIGYADMALAQNDSADTHRTEETVHDREEFDQKRGGHVGKNGTMEELLTGDIAAKVTAAALAVKHDAIIDRVETDAEGSAYEAHIRLADGSHSTLKFDNNFNVTATEAVRGPTRQ